MQVLFLYGTRKPKPRIKWTTTQTAMYCETFWLQAFGTRNSSLTNAKVYVLLYSLILFNFEFEGNFQVQAPGACIWRGDLREDFLRYEVGGLYLEGLIHEEAYFQNFTVTLRYVRGPLCYSFKFLCSQQCAVKYRKWSRDRKGSPKWTANDPRPQVIPKVDRKWSRI